MKIIKKSEMINRFLILNLIKFNIRVKILNFNASLIY